ncbi:hypothetical protein J0X19_21450 [Hymenobacter sp. BT186]|uniref:Uncharacterized protein n=1 Tax=Hymenobacter telluris TaxID=2816474 RepID=A0A939F0J5_9BACT|nr:hypothetical protein [Hymenobacter telluris]MBO0360542.1 hypothetical protein [Hymenobacter telluris]MBW3376569.1 hypothetical protein [Hymenobacter norwichensis]
MENIHAVESVSGWIGGGNHELKIRFDSQDILIRNLASSKVLVRIPYDAIEVVEAPTTFQVSKLSEREYSPGKFQVGDVRIELPAYWADQLLQHMAAAPPPITS